MDIDSRVLSLNVIYFFAILIIHIFPFSILHSQIQNQFIRKKKIQLVDLSTNKNTIFS